MAVLAVLPLQGCIYSFTGGGLPAHIRTVAIQTFDNTTAQPLLETDIQRALQVALPRSLGVRLAEEGTADAVVRGKVTSYDEVAASIRPVGPGEQEVPVVQRQIRISYEAEIYDVREDKPIWTANSQSVVGNFQPESEAPDQGRARAITELVNKLIEGAQSQW
jgi:hypothetical protein